MIYETTTGLRLCVVMWNKAVLRHKFRGSSGKILMGKRREKGVIMENGGLKFDKQSRHAWETTPWMNLFVKKDASKQSCQVGRDEWILLLINSCKVTAAFEDQHWSMPFSRDGYSKVESFFFLLFYFYVSVVLGCLKQTTSHVCAPVQLRDQSCTEFWA